MTWRRLVVVAVSAFSAFGANAADVAELIEAAKAEIKSNSVDRTTRCRYYKAWFVDQCSKAEHDAILERNVAAHRRWMELSPGNMAPRADLGCVYAAAGKWKEAETELEAAHSVSNRLDFWRRVMVGWELANCRWLAGDRDGAKRLIAETAAIKQNGDSPPEYWRAKYLDMMFSGEDADLDVFQLPHSEDGRPFPVAHEAKYGEKKISLARVELKFRPSGTNGTDGTSPASRISPVSHEDPIIRLLKRKLTRFGSTFAPGGTPILIELSPNAPVDKPQGYSIDAAKGKVVVKARTRLGLTWGVVSLIQCVERRDIPSICEMAIRDWPDCVNHGTLASWDGKYLEFALFNKISSIDFHMDKCYTLPPLAKELYRIYAGRFNDFGIETYCISREKTMRPLLALSEPRTRALHLAWARFSASVGMGFSFHLDDERFPMRPEDLKAAGTAANLDAKYLTGIYREVKKDYPGFRMLFCPPFYWGPDSPACYPEPRKPYLESLGADLDREIGVYWTGGSVGSWDITPKEAKWFSELIGRKQTIFHNGDCANAHYSIQYGADVSAYKKSHCAELFSLIDRFHQNSSRLQEATEVASAMDWCWNREGHEPRTAVRRAVEQLEGPGVFEVLEEATPAIAYFDKYRYGEPRPELFAEDQADIDARVAMGEKAWSNVLAIAKNNGFFVADFNRCGVRWAKKLAECKRNPPEWFKKKVEAAMASKEFAEREAGLDESKGDVFIPAAMLFGGRYITGIESWGNKYKRNVKYVAPGEEASAEFECVPFPPSAPYTIVVNAMSFLEKPPTIELEVNGRVVWRGDAFIAHYFTGKEFEIPVDALSRHNKFVIRNVSDNTPKGKQVLIHYAVVRKQGKGTTK